MRLPNGTEGAPCWQALTSAGRLPPVQDEGSAGGWGQVWQMR